MKTVDLDRAAWITTAALFGWAAGVVCGWVAVPRMDKLTVESQALQLAQEREVVCAQARALVRQHEIVKFTWPDAPRPIWIEERCDQDGVGTPRPRAEVRLEQWRRW